MHTLYLVDEVKKDSVSREQLVKVEKAFEVAEAAKLKAIALQAKFRGQKLELAEKLDAEKKKARPFRATMSSSPTRWLA